MRVWVLGSGSRGNAVLLEHRGSRVLVDAGFHAKALEQRLAAIDVSCESIEALVVTHEHHDHVRGACAAARAWGWALHASCGTVAAYPSLRDADVRTFDAGATLRFSSMELQSVSIPHDAEEPVAIIATDDIGGRVGIVYDLGYVNAALRRALGDLDVLVLEANHDEGMLRAGPYPPTVRDRIAGRRGHLSNSAAADVARDVAHPSLAHVVLAHLSDQCNDASLARSAVSRGLAPTRFTGAVHAAPQDAVVGPFEPKVRRGRIEQLRLEL
ncbi:MAG TPA: MBL fold metallo-hydrolase [Gemmatimonadaceae bacterium]|nr:MBL fold metallo-hydrolase [Gemmatimonadaceae bacterium]